MARSIRQSKIIDIISKAEIETQDEICDQLNKSGFNVTQATVSRDIKELGLIKTIGKNRKYKYSFIESEQKATGKMINLFKESVIFIKAAQNLIVVKTLSGNGSNAGMCVDKLNLSEIIGSVAGDDTLLIVTDNNENAVKVADTLQNLLK